MFDSYISAKCHLVFLLTKENAASWRFYFTTNRKTLCSFKTALHLQDPQIFYVTITRDFESFQVFNFSIRISYK